MRKFVWCIGGILFFTSIAHAIDGGNVEWLTPVNVAGTDWKTFELITANDSVAALSGAESFSWSGRASWDGAGAFQLNGSTLRVFVNHETTPAAITHFDLNRANLAALAAQPNGTTWAGGGQVVSGIGNGFTSISGDANLARFCSANVWEADTFGPGRGFADRMFLTAEEVSGGQFYALDPATQILHQAPDLGAGVWESATPIDSGRTDTVALLLNEDAGASATGTAPLRLYVGLKNAGGNFLQRNGLSGGTVYYWDPDGTANTDGTIDGPLFDTDANAATDASGNSVTGTWVASSAAAARFSKLEDTHVNTQSANPGFGREAVVANQDEGLYHVDLQGLSFIAGDLAANQQSAVKLLLQAAFDQDPNGNIRGFDNLVWSPDGRVYVNEDGSSGEVWQLDPDNALMSALNIVDLNTAIAAESSGIFDISAAAGFLPGSLFLSNVHNSTLANNQLVLLVSPTATPIPEPASLALLVVLCPFLRRRR
ncbi:MAG: hypothetical protein ABIP55_03550 [Tepidisphaeraceae bacterium]